MTNDDLVSCLERSGLGLALKQIAHSLAYLIVNTGELKDKTNKERITLLASLGFDRHSIASLLGTTPLTVSVALSKYQP